MKKQALENDFRQKKAKQVQTVIAFVLTAVLLLMLTILSCNIGSLKVSPGDLFRGLFVEYNPKVATIYDLRLPRIMISLLAGAGVSVAGVIFQAVLKNPLADPGIIGISAGAGFFSSFVLVLFPGLFFLTPVVACLGGLFAFFLVYSLSWKNGLSPLRIILVGVAVSAMFTGLAKAISFASGSERSGVAALINGNITMKTWDDVYLLLPYTLIGIFPALFSASKCNLMALEDKTLRSLGVNVHRQRILLSVIACLLASSSTAIVGAISFLGLIVPHIGRLLVGSDHRKLIPFSILFGAFTFLLADTVGRTLVYPYELPAAIVMSVIGGPFFIILLRRSNKYANA